MIHRLLKSLDAAKVVDRLLVAGGVRGKSGGIRLSDGTAVPVEVIQHQFGVSRERAIEIQAKVSR